MTNEELRRLAEAATPGPWSVFHPERDYFDPRTGHYTAPTGPHVVIKSGDAPWETAAIDGDNDEANAAYIAAANPAAVLALLNRLAEAEAIVAQVRGGVSPRARLCAAMGQWLANQQHWTDLPDDHPVLESRATDGGDFVITAGMIREANR